MKSVKPGRGPSMMNAAGSIFAILFGIIWTAIAMSSGASFFFSLFGICFIGLAVVQAVYNFKNATGKNRYSAFDIVDEDEENDPLNERFGGEREIREAVMRERAQIAEAAKNRECGTKCRNAGKYKGSRWVLSLLRDGSGERF